MPPSVCVSYTHTHHYIHTHIRMKTTRVLLYWVWCVCITHTFDTHTDVCVVCVYCKWERIVYGVWRVCISPCVCITYTHTSGWGRCEYMCIGCGACVLQMWLWRVCIAEKRTCLWGVVFVYFTVCVFVLHTHIRMRTMWVLHVLCGVCVLKMCVWCVCFTGESTCLWGVVLGCGVIVCYRVCVLYTHTLQDDTHHIIYTHASKWHTFTWCIIYTHTSRWRTSYYIHTHIKMTRIILYTHTPQDDTHHIKYTHTSKWHTSYYIHIHIKMTRIILYTHTHQDEYCIHTHIKMTHIILDTHTHQNDTHPDDILYVHTHDNDVLYTHSHRKDTHPHDVLYAHSHQNDINMIHQDESCHIRMSVM